MTLQGGSHGSTHMERILVTPAFLTESPFTSGGSRWVGRKLGELDVYKLSFLGGTTLTPPAHKLHVTHGVIVCRKGSGPDP